MKDIFYKVVFGFLFGLGLSVAVLLSFFATDYFSDTSRGVTYKKFNEDSGLIISNKNERKINDGVVVLGEVHNKGSDTWRYIKLEAEIYDKDGVFIDECTTNIDKELLPNQKENFKITCGGCSNNRLPELGKFTVIIKGASHVADKDT